MRGFPTFHFYLNQQKVDELVGADQNKLRQKVDQWRQSAFNPFASPGMTLGGTGAAPTLSTAEAREARLKRFANVNLVPSAPTPTPAPAPTPTPTPAPAPAAASQHEAPDVSMVCDPATGVCRPADAAKEEEEAKDGEEASDVPSVNEELLSQLQEMGFNELRSRKALLATGGQGLELAINWISDHQDDPDIDAPIKFVDMSKHVKAPLTAEQKAAKVAELKAKIELKRQERAVQEKVDSRENELKRRTMGQGMQEAREEYEAMQRRMAAEKQRKEKEDAKRDRERIRRQLEMDKLERRARGGRLGGPPIDLPSVETLNNGKADDAKKSPVVELSPEEAVVANIEKLKKYRVGNDGLTALKTLNVYMKNLLEKPEEDKFRTINLENAAFRKRVASFVGGVALLRSVGYEKDDSDGNLKLAVEKRDPKLLQYARTQLDIAIAELS